MIMSVRLTSSTVYVRTVSMSRPVEGAKGEVKGVRKSGMEPEDRKGLCGRRWTREASGGKGGTGGVSKARSRNWAVW